MGRFLLALAGTAMLALPAASEEAGPAVGRYAITPEADGFTRLDTRTGAVSHCTKRDDVWTCQPFETEAGLAPKLLAIGGDIDRLSAEVGSLSARVRVLAARVEAIAAQAEAPAVPQAARTEAGERRPGLANEVVRRLFAMVRKLKGEGAGPG
jgi:hypothetical protein